MSNVEVPPEAYQAAVRRVGLLGHEVAANRYRDAVDAAAPLIVAAYLEKFADGLNSIDRAFTILELRVEAAKLRGKKPTNGN